MQTVKKVESYEQINIQSIIKRKQDTGEGDTATTGNNFQGLEVRRRAEKSERGTGCIGPKNTA